MATKLLKLVTFFSILLALQTHLTFSLQNDQNLEDDDDVDESYVLDSPFANTHLRSRFLASVKKGKSCSTYGKKNVCNGVPANNGASMLYCCKSHCRDVLGDANNCGGCGHKCGFGEKCCGGTCINVHYNNNNCGKCYKVCKGGKTCDNSHCGYAY